MLKDKQKKLSGFISLIEERNIVFFAELDKKREMPLYRFLVKYCFLPKKLAKIGFEDYFQILGCKLKLHLQQTQL